MKNIVFIVETNYQIMYSMILNSYINKKTHQTTLIFANTQLNEKFRPDEFNCFDNLFYFDKEKGKNGLISLLTEVWFVKKNKKHFNKIDCSLVVVYKDSNFLQGYLLNFFKKRKKSKTLIIEEGLSMYGDKELHRKKVLRNIKSNIRILIMRMLKAKHITYGFGYNRLLDSLASFEPDKLPASKTINKSIFTLPNVPPSETVLDRIYEIFSMNKYININDVIIQDNFLYIGQNLVESNTISKDSEELLLTRLNFLAAKYETYLIIKPHPLEDFSKYFSYNRFVVIQNSFIPAELIFLKTKSKKLLTPFSSAGVNISRWWKTECFLVHELLGVKIDFKVLKQYSSVSSYDQLEKIFIKENTNNLVTAEKASHDDFDLEYIKFINTILY